jgi:lysophospholipase L1-like esterase
VSDPTPSRAVRVLFACVVVLGGVGGAEIVGRVGYAVLDRAREGTIRDRGGFKSYERPDPNRPDNWVLVPGMELTLAETRALVKAEGLVLAEQALERGAERLAVPEDRVIFRTNADGYKGPELDRSGTRPRVLAIGDSCTFGSLFEYYTWPRSAERTLAALGVPAEVVNAGVNGYSPINALARLDEFRALEPRAAVIYIGWNALYGDRKSVEGDSFALQRLAGTLRSLWSMRGKTHQQLALESYHRPKRPDPDAPEIARLAAYRPEFLADVETLVRALGEAGAEVWVATLPGLYQLDEAPSERALEFGHLPQWTQNPYVLAAMAAAYNERLRELAARTGVGLIDLEAWSRSALVPRDRHFIDSVHLTEEAQERIGAYIAERIAPAIAAADVARE